MGPSSGTDTPDGREWTAETRGSTDDSQNPARHRSGPLSGRGGSRPAYEICRREKLTSRERRQNGRAQDKGIDLEMGQRKDFGHGNVPYPVLGAGSLSVYTCQDHKLNAYEVHVSVYGPLTSA